MINTNYYSQQINMSGIIKSIGCDVKFPDDKRNYTVFNEIRVRAIAQKREKALPYLTNILDTSKDEKRICETLYIIDRMCDMKVKGIEEIYSSLSKHNSSTSPNVQVLLAGIYRKTQIPDGFGPLVTMLIRNAQKPPATTYFDPSEEIGGAILEYLKNYSAKQLYSQMQNKSLTEE